MNWLASDPWTLSVGTRAVITGGTRSIGATIVDELCKKGARVLTCSRNEGELAYVVCKWRADGFDVEGVVADLSSAKGRYAFADAIRTWLQGERLDILVNNVSCHAAPTHDGDIGPRSDEIWASYFHSMFMLTSICHEHLKRNPATGQTSSVVNIASILGFTSRERNAPYPAAQAAVIKTTGDWACEWGHDGIRVNCVAPGLIDGDTQRPWPDISNASAIQQVPLGRMGQTKEVAGLVTFLCLPLAGFITGQVICVDGGYSRSEYYDKYSAAKLRQKAEEIALSTPSSTRLSLPRLEQVCRELEDYSGLTRTSSDASASVESSFSLDTKFAATNARWKAFREKRLNTASPTTESRDDEVIDRPVIRQDDTLTRDSLRTRNSYRSRKKKSRDKNTKSVSFQPLPEYSTAKESPLSVIDEIVEGDFDRSEPIDLDRVKSFRDRLKRIQEKKNSPKPTLLDMSKSLRCVFPTSGSDGFADEGSRSWDDAIFTNHRHTFAMHSDVEDKSDARGEI